MTFISFPNLIATSVGGKYRIDVRGTKSGDFFRDQGGFVYRLIEVTSDREVWTWRPEEYLPDHPQDVWVNDQGWVVARLHEWFSAGILVLSPGGNCQMLREVERFGDEGEPGILEGDEHVGGTSAGPDWAGSSIVRFHDDGGRSFWSMLLWWGRRIVVDLEAGKVLEETPEELSAALREKEKSWILETLAAHQHHMTVQAYEADEWWKEVGQAVYTAAYHAGTAGVKEAVPFLRALESCPICNSSGTESWLKVGDMSYRTIAKISLLRLGVEPRWLAGFVLMDNLTRERCEYAECPQERWPEWITIGLSQRELLKRLGAPDFMRRTWDYIFSESSALYTLRIHWQEQHDVTLDEGERFGSESANAKFAAYREAIQRDPPTVERIERIDRSPWNADAFREYGIAHGRY